MLEAHGPLAASLAALSKPPFQGKSGEVLLVPNTEVRALCVPSPGLSFKFITGIQKERAKGGRKRKHRTQSRCV